MKILCTERKTHFVTILNTSIVYSVIKTPNLMTINQTAATTTPSLIDRGTQRHHYRVVP